jgi:hypothetical protein
VPEIHDEFEKLKRSFYPLALFLSEGLQNEIFIVMMRLTNAMNHIGTPTSLDRSSKAGEALYVLGEKLAKEYDLVGTKIKLEEIGKEQDT